MSAAPDPTTPAAPARSRMRARIVAWLRGALVFSGLLPWALPYMRAHLPMGALGVLIDYVFLGMCHRRPARTLVLDGVAMPLCSRCAGIFLGVAIAALVGKPILAMRTWRLIFLGTCALMLADVVTQDLGLHPVWHATRLITGVLFGYFMVIGFLSGLASDSKIAARAKAGAPAAPTAENVGADAAVK